MLLLYVCILLVPTNTSAHAYIIKSTPMENETLNKPPALVSMEFNEAIQPKFDSLTVIDSLGQRVDGNTTHINKENPNIIETDVKSNLPNGAYTIQWKVVSADGHPVQGTIPFRIGTGTANSDSQVHTMGYIPQADMIIERGLLYTGFSLFLGVMLFHLVLYRKNDYSEKTQSRSKKIIWFSVLAITCSLLWNLPLQAKIYGNVPWSQSFHLSLWKETLSVPTFGYVWITQVILLLLFAVATYLAIKYGSFSSIKAWIVPILIFTGLLVTKTLNGHAMASKYKEIAVFMDFLHLSAASLWVGGLSAIVFLLPTSVKESHKKDWALYWDAIRRFSPWAMTAVAIIFFTGIFSSTIFIPDIRKLFDTRYGQVLAIKIILFIIMGIFGLVHLVKGKLRREKGIGLTAGTEFSIGIIILLIAGILSNLATPPLPTPVPLNETKQVNGYDITLHISPNAVGANTFDIDIKDKNGQPVTNLAQLTITAYSLDMEMGRNTVRVPMVSPGKFEVQGMQLNMEGRWRITVHGLTSSLDDFTLDFDTQVSTSYGR